MSVGKDFIDGVKWNSVGKFYRTAFNAGVFFILAKLLGEKIGLRMKLEQAYETKNFEMMKEVLVKVDLMIDLHNQLDASFRKLWVQRNKFVGLDTIQRRLAGLARRYRELSDRIRELIEGKIDKIEELEGLPNSREDYISYGFNGYASVISGTLLQ